MKEWKAGRLKAGRRHVLPLPLSPEAQERFEHHRQDAANIGYDPATAERHAFQQVAINHGLGLSDLEKYTDFLRSGSPHARGIDLHRRDLSFADLKEPFEQYKIHQRRKQDKADIRHKGPDGTYIKALRPEECEWEGQAMGNCIARAGYSNDIAQGDRLLYSLRDKNGNPHVDMEIQPKWWKNKQTGERFTSRSVPFNPEIHEAIPQEGNVIQIHGKGNAPPHEKYQPLHQELV
jgi:hypothetical protein